MPWRKQASAGQPYGLVQSFNGGISNLGATAGTTGTVANNIVFVGTGQYSMSQSTNSTGATLTIGNDGYMQRYNPMSAYLYSSIANNPATNGMLAVQLMNLPSQVSFTEVDLCMSISISSTADAATAAIAASYTAGFYSQNNSILYPLVAMTSQTTYSWASNTSFFGSLSGPRMLSFPLATKFSAGQYYFAWGVSTATSSVGTSTTSLGLSHFAPYGTIGNVWSYQFNGINVSNVTSGSGLYNNIEMWQGRVVIGGGFTGLASTSQWLMPVAGAASLNANDSIRNIFILRNN